MRIMDDTDSAVLRELTRISFLLRVIACLLGGIIGLFFPWIIRHF